MIKLKGLEDWAREILATPTPTLNRRFSGSRPPHGEDLLRKSIEELPFFTHYRPVFRQISEQTLRELHQKLHRQKCESNFWAVLLMILDHPLPNEIAFDLVERNIAILELGHSPQSESVLWRLTPLVEETILTLAKRFYTDQSRSLEEFEDVLRRFPNQEWMTESLAHCAAASAKKRRVYEKFIENHPKRDWLFSINQEIEPHQPQFSYYDLSHLSKTDQMRSLYGGYSPQQLVDIARDDATPDEILLELEALRGVSNASEIRFAVRHNLQRREEARMNTSE